MNFQFIKKKMRGKLGRLKIWKSKIGYTKNLMTLLIINQNNKLLFSIVFKILDN